jgi:microcystin-dependent protein
LATPFLGEIKLFALNFAPRGWHFCDGTLLAISSNTALFSLLGTFYGGNGTTNFALPNLKGRAPAHFGNGQSQSLTLGETTGVETVQLTLPQVPLHSHAMKGTSAAGGAPLPNGHVLAAVTIAADHHYGLDTTVQPLNPSSIENDGGGAAHSNMQPFLVMNYCIATSGVFPTRN